MNYWETVAGQELLNLIRMEVSRYSARKQYTIKTKLQNSEETLEKELAEGAKYVSSYQYKQNYSLRYIGKPKYLT